MDLSTTYMGLKLKNPLVPSSSPLTMDVDKIRALEDAGASAVVLGSLFEEQIRHEARELDYYLEHGTERFAESLTYFPTPQEFRRGPEDYLDLIAAAREAVEIPVIASLNGVSAEGLMDYARKIEQAGASALELNVYFLATDPNVSGRQVEDVYASILEIVKQTVADVALALRRRAGRPGPAAGRRRRRRPGALQPVLPAGHRRQDAGGRPEPGPVGLAREPPAPAVDRHPVRAGGGVPRGDDGHPHGPR